MKTLCIYHGGCDDGFGAAWAVRAALGESVEFYPGVYQKDPPPTEGRDVVFVDFSYKRPVLDEMAKIANSILILDHHKTAQEDLSDLPKPPAIWRSWIGATHLPKGAAMVALFDMDRSGSALAWDYFNGGIRPEFINYLQDRDLWRKQLPFVDEFTIALRSYPQDFDVWDELVERGVNGLIDEGAAIQRYYRRRVDEFKDSAYPALIGGQKCWISNAPYFAASEVAGELCDRADFGACYFEDGCRNYKYSLRSRGDFDVSEIARQFGGGGHKNAAGFSSNLTVHMATS
jgi:hypothetical protein